VRLNKKNPDDKKEELTAYILDLKSLPKDKL